ncbi:hypothetical protein HUS23_01860 [Ectothiorhodospiraceae bacterium 2226]|nr:hypothetical protein HUS23_01860 [Ectothiorhodospiraceae bacterium 2226]
MVRTVLSFTVLSVFALTPANYAPMAAPPTIDLAPFRAALVTFMTWGDRAEPADCNIKLARSVELGERAKRYLEGTLQCVSTAGLRSPWYWGGNRCDPRKPEHIVAWNEEHRRLLDSGDWMCGADEGVDHSLHAESARTMLDYQIPLADLIGHLDSAERGEGPLAQSR